MAGLSTVAGSWIGGGANQAAMLEIYKYNPEKYGAMVIVDIVVANIWMAFLLFGIGKSDKIDRWLKADNSSIEDLKNRVISFSEKTKKQPTLVDYKVMLALAFGGVGLSHFGADIITDFLKSNFESIRNAQSATSFFGDTFFWLVTFATLIGILLSFTKARNYEGAGASKLGSVFIYVLVATIGMKMNLTQVFDNPGLLLVGLIWMAIHVLVMFLVAKIIRAPYFFLAVGSKANVGGCFSTSSSFCFPSFTSNRGRTFSCFRLCSRHLRSNAIGIFDGNSFSNAINTLFTSKYVIKKLFLTIILVTDFL